MLHDGIATRLCLLRAQLLYYDHTLLNVWSKPTTVKHPEIPNEELCYSMDRGGTVEKGWKTAPIRLFPGEGNECPLRDGWAWVFSPSCL